MAMISGSSLTPEPPVNQRLFFALWPDDATRTALAEVAEDMPHQGRGRMVHPEDLHLTLIFLGDTPSENISCLTEAADSLHLPGFSLTLDRVECWGRGGILWCGPTETPSGLRDLFSSLQQGLAGCGFPPERRPFRAHITLARNARDRPPVALEHPILWQARELVLVRSELGRKPPRYSVLKRWSLTPWAGTGD